MNCDAGLMPYYSAATLVWLRLVLCTMHGLCKAPKPCFIYMSCHVLYHHENIAAINIAHRNHTITMRVEIYAA